MHLLLLVSLVAAVVSGDEYGKCKTQSTIQTECESHLSYLEDGATLKTQLTIGKLSDPVFLVDNMRLDKLCNDTMHLKMYYNCMFTNVTACVVNNNGTDENIPDVDVIANGVVALCDNRDAINATCVSKTKAEVDGCVAAKDHKHATDGSELCEVYREMVECMEDLEKCEGSDVVKDFINSARPRDCGDISAASQTITTLSLLLFTLLSSLLLSL